MNTARESDDDIWLDPNESPGYLLRDTNIAVGKALRRRLAAYNMTLGQYYFMRALWIEDAAGVLDRWGGRWRCSVPS